MGRKLPKIAYKAKDAIINCNKQFPDCPTEPNDSFCKPCPLYKK